MNRPGSSIPQFIKRVPVDIRSQLIGRRLIIPLGDGTVTATVDKQGVIRFSLGSRDPSEAKGRQADALAYLERLFDAERNNRPIELSRRLAVALAGILYRAWIDGQEREQTIALQHGPNGWERVYGSDPDGSEEAAGFRAVAAQMAALGDGADIEALERVLGPVVDVVGARPDVMLPRLTPGSRAMVLVEFARAVRDMAERRARQAEGNYSSDPNSERFPAWERPLGASITNDGDAGTPSSLPEVTLTGLVEDWWAENSKPGIGRSKSTYENYKGAFRKLVAFLERDKSRKQTANDATRLTAQDVVGFKDYRLNVEKVAPRTVNDNDLAALRSVLGWAVDNKKLPANVALGIRLKRVVKESGRPFTEEEAKALLRNASAARWSGLGHEGMALARRWVPWLMAYSGARVGEIAQLRKEDVKLVREGDAEHWVYVITKEAGTVKGGKSREVPVHPHLVELGFIEMVKSASKGHLFVRPNAETGDVLGPLKGVTNRLAQDARKIVPDKSVDPNHGWRHRFTVLCYEHNVSDDLSRVIVGHSGKDVHSKVYGLKGKGAGLYREMCKIPAITIRDCNLAPQLSRVTSTHEEQFD